MNYNLAQISTYQLACLNQSNVIVLYTLQCLNVEVKKKLYWDPKYCDGTRNHMEFSCWKKGFGIKPLSEGIQVLPYISMGSICCLLLERQVLLGFPATFVILWLGHDMLTIASLCLELDQFVWYQWICDHKKDSIISWSIFTEELIKHYRDINRNTFFS